MGEKRRGPLVNSVEVLLRQAALKSAGHRVRVNSGLFGFLRDLELASSMFRFEPLHDLVSQGKTSLGFLAWVSAKLCSKWKVVFAKCPYTREPCTESLPLMFFFCCALYCILLCEILEKNRAFV